MPRLGRPKHSPTDETRVLVRDYLAMGARDEDIALKLGISEPTLNKYYKTELSLGKIEANATIAKTLYKKAKNGDTTAMIFWLKTRAGWREIQKMELSGIKEEPLHVKHDYDLDNLSEEELLQMRSLLVKAKKP